MTAAIELQASTALLNQIYEEFAAENPQPAVRRACEIFRLLRSQMQAPEWTKFCRHGVSQHPVHHVLRQHLQLTETFRNRRNHVARELNAIVQEKNNPAILLVEQVPVDHMEQRFDVVYAADLFDTLETVAAAHLLPRLVQMLRPNGRLLVTNVAPGVRESAYLEVCSKGIPQYRSEEEMAALTTLVPERQISSQCVYRDETGGTVFLEIQRAAL